MASLSVCVRGLAYNKALCLWMLCIEKSYRFFMMLLKYVVNGKQWNYICGYFTIQLCSSTTNREPEKHNKRLKVVARFNIDAYLKMLKRQFICLPNDKSVSRTMKAKRACRGGLCGRTPCVIKFRKIPFFWQVLPCCLSMAIYLIKIHTDKLCLVLHFIILDGPDFSLLIKIDFPFSWAVHLDVMANKLPNPEMGFQCGHRSVSGWAAPVVGKPSKKKATP